MKMQLNVTEIKEAVIDYVVKQGINPDTKNIEVELSGARKDTLVADIFITDKPSKVGFIRSILPDGSAGYIPDSGIDIIPDGSEEYPSIRTKQGAEQPMNGSTDFIAEGLLPKDSVVVKDVSLPILGDRVIPPKSIGEMDQEIANSEEDALLDAPLTLQTFDKAGINVFEEVPEVVTEAVKDSKAPWLKKPVVEEVSDDTPLFKI